MCLCIEWELFIYIGKNSRVNCFLVTQCYLVLMIRLLVCVNSNPESHGITAHLSCSFNCLLLWACISKYGLSAALFIVYCS